MGWKGTLRSVRAAYRAADRAAQRRQRELAKIAKERAKMEALEQAQYEVSVFENQIELILSVHKERSHPINWGEVAFSPEPKEPQKSRKREAAEFAKLRRFKPGFFTKILGRTDKAKANREAAVVKAKELDEKAYQKAHAKWRKDHEQWTSEVNLAKRVLAGDGPAKLDAILQINPFSDIAELGSLVTFRIGGQSIVEATLEVRGESTIPKEGKSLLQSGKLSVKKIPVGKFYELYQDYVCSCVLRVANELMALLPDPLVIVNAVDEVLDTKTGHKGLSPILSVAVSRTTLESLNLDDIDPSDAMENFVYHMNFKKTKGLLPIVPLKPEDFESSAPASAAGP